MKRFHPMLKGISDEDARAATADIYNKVSAGMDAKYILQQLRQLSHSLMLPQAFVVSNKPTHTKN